MKRLIIFFIACSVFAQEAPNRVAFLGTGWTARQGMPTTGFAGLAIKMTDAIGGVYSWSSVVATSQTNSFASGLAKPAARLGPVTGWVIGQAGVASGAGNVGFTYGGGMLLSADAGEVFKALRLPWRPRATVFAGAQVNKIGEATGIPLAGVNLSPGFGFAIPWGQ